MYKRTALVASLLLAIVLLSAIMIPAQASAKQQKQLKFQSIIKGPGILYWGIAKLPTISWGSQEYSDTLDESDVKIAGISDAQGVVPPNPTVEKMLELSNIQLDKMELTAGWTTPSMHELRLRFESTVETDGVYVESWWPNDIGEWNILGDALQYGFNQNYANDELEQYNPVHATLQITGTYKVDNVEYAISGRACVFIFDFLSGDYPGEMIWVCLWIDSPVSSYVTLAWCSRDMIGASGTEGVPPAQQLIIYMKEKK